MAEDTRTYHFQDYRITGITPLLMQNSRMAIPGHRMVKELKKLTGLKDKTDETHQKIAEVEWEGSLYTKGDYVVMPGCNVEGVLVETAALYKKKKLARAAIFVPGDPLLEYDGPPTLSELKQVWEDWAFQVIVRLGRSRILRTRPIFPTWAFTVRVRTIPGLISEETVFDWFTIAGEQIGFGSWRPRYGQFSVARL